MIGRRSAWIRGVVAAGMAGTWNRTARIAGSGRAVGKWKVVGLVADCQDWRCYSPVSERVLLPTAHLPQGLTMPDGESVAA